MDGSGGFWGYRIFGGEFFGIQDESVWWVWEDEKTKRVEGEAGLCFILLD